MRHRERARDIKPPIKRSISASLLPASLCTVFIITSGERKTLGRAGREGGGEEKVQKSANDNSILVVKRLYYKESQTTTATTATATTAATIPSSFP